MFISTCKRWPSQRARTLGNFFHLRHVLGGVANFGNHARLGAVEHADENRLSALDHDPKDRGRNDKADDQDRPSG